MKRVHHAATTARVSGGTVLAIADGHSGVVVSTASDQHVRVAFEKHLLIDGANILHAWPELRSLLKRDRDAARARLSHVVSVIHDVEQLRVTIVFDGRGAELVLERPSGQATFTHLYTPTGTTADDVIEQLVGNAASAADCLVATDDRAEWQTVEALGAVGVSSVELARWVARLEERQRAQLSGLKRENERDWRRPKS
jgi:predicted RNA-binding protein with PIN domain